MSNTTFRLDNRIALVTGASAGLGAAIAKGLAEAGAHVACHGNTRSPDQTCKEIVDNGGTAQSVVGDLGVKETATSLVQETIERFGRLDIVINNAGTIRRAPAAVYSDEDWETVMEVNLSSLFRLSRTAGKHMLDRGEGGKIVNIASLLSFQGGITVPAYAASPFCPMRSAPSITIAVSFVMR